MAAPSFIELVKGAAADLANAAADAVRIFVDVATGEPSYKDEAGVVTSLQGTAGADGADGANGADGADAPPLTYSDHGNTGSTETIDASAADVHRIVLNAATVTITLSGAPGSGAPGVIRVWVEQDGTGGRDVAWPASVDWGDPGEPVWTAMTASSVLLVDLMTVDAGTKWVAAVAGRDGPAGADGANGADGADGADGVGVPVGGTDGQVLTKQSGTDFDADWEDPTGGGASFDDYDTLIAAMSGLVHRWKFEEASGTLADAVGSLTLTASGSALTYSVAGGPISGGAGSVTLGATTKLASSGLGSIPTGAAARTFIVVWKGKAATGKGALLSYGTASTRAWWTAMINEAEATTVDSLGLDTFGDDNPPTAGAGWRPAVNLAVWHMAAFMADGDTNGAIASFVDGMFQGHAMTGALATGSSGNFTIGQDTAGGNQLAAVTLDDVAIFTRCLQPYELQQLYNALVGALP